MMLLIGASVSFRKPKPYFGVLSSGDSLLFCLKGTNCRLTNHGLPTVPSRFVNTHNAASVVSAHSAVSEIFRAGYGTQIFNAIVRTISVDVVNVLWRCAVKVYPRHSVRVLAAAKNAPVQIPVSIHMVECGLPGPPSIPVSGEIARTPSQSARSRVIVQQLPYKFLGDNWFISHLGLLRRSIWLGLVTAVQTPPSPTNIMQDIGRIKVLALSAAPAPSLRAKVKALWFKLIGAT
jgi:hypothetical protein